MHSTAFLHITNNNMVIVIILNSPWSPINNGGHDHLRL